MRHSPPHRLDSRGAHVARTILQETRIDRKSGMAKFELPEKHIGAASRVQSVDRGGSMMRLMERRSESRVDSDVSLRVWGVDTKGERFLQEARARDISLSGALLSGLDTDLRSGDVIGILYAGKQARYRVVWVRYDSTGEKMQVAVHRVAADACPWRDLLASDDNVAPHAAQASAEI